MIDKLLTGKMISQSEHDLYQLFQANELGRKVINVLMHESFMDEPTHKEFSEVGFAFYDGRRSILRDIHRSIIKVETFLKEDGNGPRTNTKSRRK